MNKNNKNEYASEKKSVWQWLLVLLRILHLLKRPSPVPSLPGRGVATTVDQNQSPTAMVDSPLKRGAGLMESAATSVAPPAKEISGPQSSMPSSRSLQSSSQASASKVSMMRSDYLPQDILSDTPIKGGRGGLSRYQLLSSLRSECKALKTPPAPLNGGAQSGSRSTRRQIDYLVLHCSDTRPDQDFTIEKLKACHKARGFGAYPGYHVYVRRDGSVYYCRPVSMRGCHVKGYNSNSIGVCYEGGRRGAVTGAERSGNGHPPKGGPGGSYEDNRTPEQKESLRQVFAVLHDCFPDARIVGHNEFGVAKACPCLSKESMEAFRDEIIHWRE